MSSSSRSETRRQVIVPGRHSVFFRRLLLFAASEVQQDVHPRKRYMYIIEPARTTCLHANILYNNFLGCGYVESRVSFPV